MPGSCRTAWRSCRTGGAGSRPVLDAARPAPSARRAPRTALARCPRPGYSTHLAVLGRKSRRLGWPRPFPSLRRTAPLTPARETWLCRACLCGSTSRRQGQPRDRQRPDRFAGPLGPRPLSRGTCRVSMRRKPPVRARPLPRWPRPLPGSGGAPPDPRKRLGGCRTPRPRQGPRGPWRAARVGGAAAPARSGPRGRCRGYADERLRSQAFPAPSGPVVFPPRPPPGAHVRVHRPGCCLLQH